MNNNEFPNMNNMQIDPSKLMAEFRTAPLTRFLVSLLFGIIPMLFAIIFITATGQDFPQFANNGNNRPISLDYGYLWLIGIGLILLSTFLSMITVKFVKDVKLDVIPSTISKSFGMFSLFIIPLPWWAFIFLIPIFMIIGTVLGQIAMMLFSLKSFQKNMKKLQDDMGNLEDILNNPNANNTHPFVDVKPETKKEEKKEDTINPYVKFDDEDED